MWVLHVYCVRKRRSLIPNYEMINGPSVVEKWVQILHSIHQTHGVAIATTRGERKLFCGNSLTSSINILHISTYTVRKVLADFAVCDWRCYIAKVLCDVKFSHIEGNSRKFSHIQLSNIVSSVKLSNSARADIYTLRKQYFFWKDNVNEFKISFPPSEYYLLKPEYIFS